MTATASPLPPGSKIGGYVVERLLGHGGMGDVYLARDMAQERPVALKVLPAEATHDVGRQNRLQLEGRVLQSLRHPYICSVFEIGEDAGCVFLAMEYVEGRTLHDVMAGGRLDPARVVEIGTQLAEALEAARLAGVVHRDLKGANVMVLPSGDIKVLDFGLAKFASSSEQRLMNPVARPTDPGLIFGTAEFMSPEQALGREVDHRSDLFSLGVILFELLTGGLPFKGDTRMELFWSILNTQPPSVVDVNPDVSPSLAALVAKLLRKDAKDRPQTADEVRLALEGMRPKPGDDRIKAKAERRRWIARVGGSALGVVLTLTMLPFVQAGGSWVDNLRETSVLNAGTVWLSTDLIYDMTRVVDRAVRPSVAWVRNDGGVLYSTMQSGGRSALWLKVPGEPTPRLVVTDAGSAAVAQSDQVFFARNTAGLFRTTLAGVTPEQVADGPVLHPYASRDGRTVTFVRPAGGGYTLWGVPSEGGPPYRLSPIVASGIPRVSPDLSRVAIQQSHDVLICDLPGCGNQETLPIDSLLGWTPDGTSLVHLGAPGIANIWLTNIEDGSVRQLTRFTDETTTSVAWSGNGRRIAVTRQPTLADVEWFGLFRR